MLLENRIAIIYGGGGAIGGAIARAFAREGAYVHLAGRTQPALDAVADDITKSGGRAQTAVVDALDEAQVDAHADAVVHAAGRLDISVNVITDSDVQGTPLVDMRTDDYLSPVLNGVRARFLTSRAAARHMTAQRSGVILFFGGEPDPGAHRHHQLGGLMTEFAAVEQMRRQLASELGDRGIRVITLRTSGVPESITDAEFRARVEPMMAGSTLLGRTATLDDVGNVAVFAASDWARTITGAAINMTCGAMLD
jgi:3-oxoacyl-[acyl-carrier protein] reductase